MGRASTRVQVGASFGLLVAIIACSKPPDTAAELRQVAREELGLTTADICSDGTAAMQAKLEEFVKENCSAEGQTDKNPLGGTLYTLNACYGFVDVPKLGLKPLGYLDQPPLNDAVACTTFARAGDTESGSSSKPERTKKSQTYTFVARGRVASAADGRAEIQAQSTLECTRSTQTCQSKPKPGGMGMDPPIIFLANRNAVSGSATGMTIYDYTVTGFGLTALKDNLMIDCSGTYPTGGGQKVTGRWVERNATACKGQ